MSNDGGTQLQVDLIPIIVTVFDTGTLFNGTTLTTGAGSKITVDATGIYLVNFNASCGASPNRDWTFQIYRNNVAQANLKVQTETDAANDPQAVSIQGLISLTNGQFVDVRVLHSTPSNPTDLVFTGANLNIVRLE